MPCRLCQASIDFTCQSHNLQVLTYHLRSPGYVAGPAGDLEHAAELLRKSLRLNQEIDRWQGVCACLPGLAAVLQT